MADDIQSFIFGPGTDNLTYEQLRRRQAIATAVASQKRAFPKTFGEGLTYLGESVGERLQEQRLAEAEKAMEVKRLQQQSDILRGPTSVPAAAPTPPAAAAAPARPAAPVAPARPAPMGGAPPPPLTTGAPTSDLMNPTPMAQQRDRIAALVAQQQGAEQPQVQATPEVAQPNPTLPGAAPPVQAEAFSPSPEQTPSMPPTSLGGPAADDPIIERRRSAIGGIESDGSGSDPYAVVGKPTRGNYPLGRFQVMSNNLPEWSAAALGREVTPQEFLGSKDIQNAIFDHRFGGYADKYGDEGAARAWYAGERGMGNLNATDRFGRLNVQQYGQGYLRRLGRDRTSDAGGTSSGAPVQLASLGPGVSGSMSDAPSPGAASLLPRVPGVNDDENPPTPTNIAPAPDANTIRTQLAQASNRTIPGALRPTSDMLSPTPMNTRQQAAPNSAPASIPGATSQVYVAPKPVPPDAPPPVPMTPREQRARMISATADDPHIKQTADAVVAEEAEKRKYEQDRNNTAYAAAVQHYQQRDTAYQTSVGTQQERQSKLNSELAAEAQRKAYGNLPEPIMSKLTKSKEEADTATSAMEAIQNAKVAVEAGTIFGLGASLRLQQQRLLAAAGDEKAARIVAATENYPTNLGGLIGQSIRQYGGTQISNTDRQFGERMSGGDISLNEQTTRRLLDIGERSSKAKIADHNQLLDAALQGQPALLREVYKSRDAVSPTPMSEPIPNFRSEAEAEAAGLKPGTKIKINGRGATVH